MIRLVSTPCFDLGFKDLAAGKDVVLCDVWGVIHNGVSFSRSTVDALVRFRRDNGGTVILITNAPAPEANVIRRLDALGVPREAYDRAATSGDVTAEMIAAAGCPPLFNIGPAEDAALYAEAARRGPRAPALVAPEAASLAVCIGLDGTGDQPAAYDGLLVRLKARGLTLICANPDIVVEVGTSLVYCAGAIAARYVDMGGAVVQAGKPFAPIYERALAMAKAIRGSTTSKERIIAVGDAAHTDMLGASRQGIDAVLITGGIHRAELHPTGRSSPLDHAALAHLIEAHGVRPLAALTEVTWEL